MEAYFCRNENRRHHFVASSLAFICTVRQCTLHRSTCPTIAHTRTGSNAIDEQDGHRHCRINRMVFHSGAGKWLAGLFQPQSQQKRRMAILNKKRVPPHPRHLPKHPITPPKISAYRKVPIYIKNFFKLFGVKLLHQ